MQQSLLANGANNALSTYFSRANLPSQQETLGTIVVEILRSGRTLNRKAICVRLLARCNTAVNPEEEQHYQELVALLFRD